MQIAKITKEVDGGFITIPPSKSVAHRAIICASLSQGASTIYNIDNSDDIKATLNFVTALGRNFTYENKTLTITDYTPKKNETIDCFESGSTLRFIVPIMSALGINAEFIGKGRLPERPIGIYKDLLNGVSFSSSHLPFSISGKLKSGVFHLPGNISSQFITGLLFALPLLDGDSEIILTSPLQSKSYVDITVDVMKDFGVLVEETVNAYSIKGNQQYKAKNYTVEGDWSQAGFFLSLGAISKNKIILKGLNKNSKQGDKICFDIFNKMNINCSFIENDLHIEKSNNITAITVDVSDCPDIVPTLACTMSLANGISRITNAGRLRIKESDRLSAIANAINILGGKVSELEDELIITGPCNFVGTQVNSCKDHRILMAVSTLKAMTKGDIFLTDAHCINKSYPNYYKDYMSIGGKIDVIDMG